MDDLRRLYEHQTMMAIGIYSFLDNLLTQIPSQTDTQTGPESSRGYSTLATRTAAVPFHIGASELTGGLMELNRADSFSERRERVRQLPRLSTSWSTSNTAPNVANEPTMDSARTTTSDSDDNVGTVIDPPKVEVTPGGYPEDIFIYLSEREKEEYTCAICYSVLKEAYQCKNEHRFCYGCIYTWSTGPSAGHDGCPVCRCDGLYAKNFDLVEKIDRKRARCIDQGCNWMGFLGDYPTHIHRKYSPYELDVLISGTWQHDRNKYEESGNSLAVGLQDEKNELTEHPDLYATDSYPNIERLETETVGSVPDACTPLDISTEHPVTHRAEDVVPRSVSNLRRGSRPPRSRHQQSPIPRITERRPTPNRNTPLFPHCDRAASRSRASSRQSSIGSGGSTHHVRPPQPRRNMANAAYHSQTQTNETCRVDHARTNSRQRTNSGQTTRSNIPASPNRLAVPVVPDQTRDNRLLPLRATNGSERQVTSSPPEISAEQRSNVPERGVLFESDRTEECTAMDDTASEAIRQNVQTYHRDSDFCLPLINSNPTLISRQSSGLSYEANGAANEPTNIDSPYRIRTAAATAAATTVAATESSRPLEFRRLVPRRNRRVSQQLRETREQLAAMLRMMTLELEERRQQVLAAALETASRRRLLRSVTSRLPSHAILEETEQEQLRPDPNRFPPTPSDRQNNNIQDSLSILRNLPTPERPAPRYSHHPPLHHLTSRLMGERFHFDEDDPTAHTNRHRRRPMPDETRLSTASSTESSPDDQPNSMLIPRLLTRLRSGSTGPQSQAPSIVVVTGRRNLGHLLAELRYRPAEIHRWSSEEEDDSEDYPMM